MVSLVFPPALDVVVLGLVSYQEPSRVRVLCESRAVDRAMSIFKHSDINQYHLELPVEKCDIS